MELKKTFWFIFALGVLGLVIGYISQTPAPALAQSDPYQIFPSRAFQPLDRVVKGVPATLTGTPVAYSTPNAYKQDLETLVSNTGSANELVYACVGGVTEVFQVPKGYPPVVLDFSAAVTGAGVTLWTAATSGATVFGNFDIRLRR